MSIYIKGMEMPITCCHCPLMGYDPDREWFDSMARTGAHICVLTGALIDNTKREEHCPLVPVPEHGRLIDADALVNANEKTYDNLRNGDEISTQEATIAYLLTNEIIQRAKTIIPAEEGEG